MVAFYTINKLFLGCLLELRTLVGVGEDWPKKLHTHRVKSNTHYVYQATHLTFSSSSTRLSTVVTAALNSCVGHNVVVVIMVVDGMLQVVLTSELETELCVCACMCMCSLQFQLVLCVTNIATNIAREREREGGREGKREGERERGREGEREREREGERERERYHYTVQLGWRTLQPSISLHKHCVNNTEVRGWLTE